MKHRIEHPAGLPAPAAYAHVVATRGATTLYLSGQVALNADGQLVGAGDIAAQAEQAYANLGLALRAAGAGFADIVKLTIYVADYRSEYREPLRQIRERLFAPAALPACTVVGVAALGRPGLMIEIDATAVIG